MYYAIVCRLKIFGGIGPVFYPGSTTRKPVISDDILLKRFAFDKRPRERKGYIHVA